VPGRGRKPSALIDDRARKAESTDVVGRPNKQRLAAVITALSPSSPPPATEPAKPAIDAYTLLALWRRARREGNLDLERHFMTELERLATRPTPREGGEHDSIRD
jgi:hypothetical protein